MQSWLWAAHHPDAPLPLRGAICKGEGRCFCCQRQQSVRRCSAFRVHSGMEITPLHHSRTGRGSPAPGCAAVLEQGLMAGGALGQRSQLSSPCLWGCAAAGSTAAPSLLLFLVTPRGAAELLWPAAGAPLGACSHQRLLLPAASWLLCRTGCPRELTLRRGCWSCLWVP